MGMSDNAITFGKTFFKDYLVLCIMSWIVLTILMR